MIESFIAVVNYSTASAAAKDLFVSQSTISHRIQLLEQELGLKLFERERGFKRMQLTESGKQFYPLALQWLELNGRMLQIRSKESIGQIRIGSMDSINQFLRPPILLEIHDQLPEIQMEFVSYHSQEIYSRLTASQMDIGFAFYPISYNNIKAVPVFREPMLMVCLPGSRYAEATVPLDSLKKKEEIYFAWNEGTARWNAEHWDEGEAPYVKVDSCALLTTFLTKPDLWIAAPASVATGLRASYGVEIHSFSEPPPDRVCYMLLRSNPTIGAPEEAQERFISLFEKQIKNHPWRY